ncbi:MAG TPA: NAD(P)-dependent oxidoreductase [Bacilli bacterium]
MKAYYSMIVDLTGKRCVVIGGGIVAERKIRALLEASAVVSVVSPTFTPPIAEWTESGLVGGQQRGYRREDIEEAFLVIAATNLPDVNYQVYLDGVEQHKLLNIADRPELSNFIVPAALRRGKLIISVSTSGASPSAALAIRNEIEHQYGEDYEKFVDFLSDFRAEVKRVILDRSQREHIFKEAAKLDILHMIRTGTFEPFRLRVMEQLCQDPSHFSLPDFLFLLTRVKL